MIDAAQVVYGTPRRGPKAMVTGVVLVLIGLCVSWNRVRDWSASTYWYQYKPTFLVMRDFEQGAGLPPPNNNPFWYRPLVGGTKPDLAEVALDQLLLRDKAGKLSFKYRARLDEIAFAKVTANDPSLHMALAEDFWHRLAAKKLASPQFARVFQKCFTATLSTEPIVMQWDNVPVQISLKWMAPIPWDSGLKSWATITSLRIDDKDVVYSNNGLVSNWGTVDIYSFGGSYDRRVVFSQLGRHQIDLQMRLEFRHEGQMIYSETRHLSTSFVETPPTFAVKLGRFLIDPWHEGNHYLPVSVLKCEIVSKIFALRDLGIVEMMRRGKLGELTPEEKDDLLDRILDVQKARHEPWNGKYGDYFESMRECHSVSEDRWKRYGAQQLGFYMRLRGEVRQGDPLPIDVITMARRGNSRVGQFDATQWRLNCSLLRGESFRWNVQQMHAGEIVATPHNVEEYARNFKAEFADIPLGRHEMRGELLDYNLTWTERPQGMEIPTKYDLGVGAFDVLPSAMGTVKGVEDEALTEAVEKSIKIEGLHRFEDGAVGFWIRVKKPPIGLAFHVVIEGGDKQWMAGDVCVSEGRDLEEQDAWFNFKDAKEMPSTGLRFRFNPDSSLARRSVGIKKFWNRGVVIEGISFSGDDYKNK